ncbi:50S ribosomal protein L6 [Candidatus Gottesmanbacteria bacterium]|nr:50S ribosomal protein L6 [Candidatus Gottesmanbacteria bacterium]
MSRIAKQPITVPSDVSVTASGQTLTIRGPKGELLLKLHPQVGFDQKQASSISIRPEKDTQEMQALAATMRTLVANHIYGVGHGWQKVLELVGVGYRAAVVQNELVLTIGFSHPVKITMPKGITFTTSDNKITVSGADKQQVGEMAAAIRRLREPEPYKGKGIRYLGEIVRKKAGKAAKAVGAAATPGVK